MVQNNDTSGVYDSTGMNLNEIPYCTEKYKNINIVSLGVRCTCDFDDKTIMFDNNPILSYINIDESHLKNCEMLNLKGSSITGLQTK